MQLILQFYALFREHPYVCLSLHLLHWWSGTQRRNRDEKAKQFIGI
jgi:hypothetical protein